MFFSKMFREKPDNRIDAVFAVVALNEAEEAWREGFGAYAVGAVRDYESKAAIFADDPCDENFAEMLKAFKKKELETVYLHAARISNDAVNARRVARTVPVLGPALDCIIERLTAEADAVIDSDQKAATRLGIPYDQLASPVVRRIRARIAEAENWKSKLGELNVHSLAGVVKFVTEGSKRGDATPAELARLRGIEAKAKEAKTPESLQGASAQAFMLPPK